MDDPLLKHVDHVEEIFKFFHKINIMYRFYKSRNQDLAKMAEDEIKRVKKNKMILLKMRREKELGFLKDDESINKIKVKCNKNNLKDLGVYRRGNRKL